MGGGEGVLPVEVGGQGIPVLQADLEDLLLLHFGDQHQVVQRLKRDDDFNLIYKSCLAWG